MHVQRSKITNMITIHDSPFSKMYSELIYITKNKMVMILLTGFFLDKTSCLIVTLVY